jgi:protein-disulfide isomerase
MLKIKFLAVAACVLALSGCDRLKDPTSSDFSPTQQAKIEAIVHDYLVKNPQVLLEAGRALQEQRLGNLQKRVQDVIPLHVTELFHDTTSPSMGNPTGNLALVEFFDYQCPHCKTMTPVVDKLAEKNPGLRVIFKQLPIFGDASEMAAKAALAAQQQGKFLNLHRALMNTDQPLSEALIMKLATEQGLDSVKLKKDMQEKDNFMALKNTFALAEAMGINGTPAFVIASGINQPDPKKIRAYFYPGGVSLDALQKMLDQLQKPSSP